MSLSSLSRVLVLLGCLVALAAPTAAQTAAFVQNIEGPANSNFGYAIAVDGNTAVIGARLESSSGGAAYVVVRSGATWVLQQRLQAADATTSAQFGASVAISGETLIVGAPSARTNGVVTGAAYVFVRSGTTWTQQAKLTQTTPTLDSFVGSDVDIDGNVAVVGALQESVGNQRYGAAYVFERSGTTWTSTRIQAPTPRADLDQFGGGVGVSGTTICVGAPGWDASNTALGQGTAFVFVKSGSAWVQQQRLLGSEPSETDGFGNDCDVDGESVLVSAPGQGERGAVYAFTRSGSTWTEQQRVSGESTGGRPDSVSLRGDLFVVGNAAEDSFTGAAYIYRRTGTSWALVQRLDNTGQPHGASYGTGVATDATTVMAGAPTRSVSAGTPGNRVTVYAFGVASPLPGPPTGFAATVSGNAVSMSWAAPTSGAAATGYTLVARSPAGAVLVTQPLGNVTAYSASAPNGTYVLTLQATNASGAGPESAPVTVVLPSSVAPPGAPSGLTGAVSGSTAVFTWNPPASGGAVTNYLLVAGTSPGFSVPVASLTLPGTPGVSVPNVPAGTYYVRVLALNNGGTSGASNEVAITVGGGTLPGAPTLNAPTVSGTTVTLSWTPGSGATSHTLRAYAGGSGAPVATVPGLAGTTVTFTGVPSGSYQLELVAVNGAGSSSASPRVTLVVP